MEAAGYASPSIVVSLVGIAITILLAIIAGAVVAGKILARVGHHSHLLNNGLSLQVRQNAQAIAELSRNQGVVIEHQRGQDRRMDDMISELHDLNAGIRGLQCLGGMGRCRPAPVQGRNDDQ